MKTAMEIAMMTKPLPRRAALAACLTVLLASAGVAHAQKAAEQFIPLGQSPGLSGQSTLIGVIQRMDSANGRLTLMLGEGQSHTLAITHATRIWVDRSTQRQPTLPGSPQDLVAGRRLEAKPDAKNPGQAEWVKVEPNTP